MKYYEANYKRKHAFTPDECVIYQLVESCLKLNLEYPTALKVINNILYRCDYLFDNKSSPHYKKMNYANYSKYVQKLKKNSSVHAELYDQVNNLKINKKTKDLTQVENLLFHINDDDAPYKKYKKVDTDDLVANVLISLDRQYIF
jgi:hypothetical protein